MMSNQISQPERLVKPYDQPFTGLVIDPLAEPLARRIAPIEWITPNRVTVLGGILGIGSATAFATGYLALGGALFILRFFADCLDGKIARAQHTASHRGAALDLMIDVTGILLNFAALSWYLVRVGDLSPSVALAMVGVVGLSNWLLQYRKQLAGRAGLGSGGANGRWHTSLPLLRAWTGWCQRRQMSPVPYLVEVEIMSLGVLPLFGLRTVVTLGVAAAAVCYLLVCLVNGRRIWRVAGYLDQQNRVGDDKSQGKR